MKTFVAAWTMLMLCFCHTPNLWAQDPAIQCTLKLNPHDDNRVRSSLGCTVPDLKDQLWGIEIRKSERYVAWIDLHSGINSELWPSSQLSLDQASEIHNFSFSVQYFDTVSSSYRTTSLWRVHGFGDTDCTAEPNDCSRHLTIPLSQTNPYALLCTLTAKPFNLDSELIRAQLTCSVKILPLYQSMGISIAAFDKETEITNLANNSHSMVWEKVILKKDLEGLSALAVFSYPRNSLNEPYEDPIRLKSAPSQDFVRCLNASNFACTQTLYIEHSVLRKQ